VSNVRFLGCPCCGSSDISFRVRPQGHEARVILECRRCGLTMYRDAGTSRLAARKLESAWNSRIGSDDLMTIREEIWL